MFPILKTRFPLVVVGVGLLRPAAHALIKFNGGHDELFVTTGVGLNYDSNIFGSALGHGDTAITANLDLEYRRKAGMIGVDSTIGWNFSKFDKFSSEDFANPHLRTEFTKTEGRLTGSLVLGAARESRTDTAINLRTTSWNYNTDLTLRYPVIQRYSLGGQFGYALRKYLDNPDLVDIRTHSADLALYYLYSTGRDLLLGYRFRETSTTGETLSYDHSLTVGVTGKILPKLSGTARFGYELRQSTDRNRSNSEYSAFTMAVSTVWRLSRRLSATAQLSQDFSTLATNETVDTLAAAFNAQFAIKTKISLFGGIGYGHTQFLSAVAASRRVDTYASATTGVSYTMSERLRVSLSYTYYKNWSTLSLSNYDRHSISLNLTSRW